MSTIFDCTDPAFRSEGLAAAQQAIAHKQCVVIPTDTVYGIAADAFSPQAVATLLAAKGRGRNMPPPVLMPRARTMDGLATEVPDAARRLAEAFWPGALTLILTAQPSLTWDLGDAKGTVALRVPNDAVALELLAMTGPLAVSSANRTGSAAAGTAIDAQQQLADSVAVYLDDGARPAGDADGADGAGGAAVAEPSTIVDATSLPLRVVRKGALSLKDLRAVVPDIDPHDTRDVHAGGSPASADPASESSGPAPTP